MTQPSVPKLSELRGHEASLAFVAWAPSDDDSLLTCANDHLIKLWRVRTAECGEQARDHREGRAGGDHVRPAGAAGGQLRGGGAARERH